MHKNKDDERIYSFVFHPAFIISFAVLLINDHILKGLMIFPVISGKLSDFAMLLFSPAVVALIIVYILYLSGLVLGLFKIKNIRISYRLNTTIIWVSIIFNAVFFVLIKSTPMFNGIFRDIINGVNILGFIFPRLGTLIDPTDNIALLSLIPAFFILKKYCVK